jgi:hypothetical protein
MNQMARTFWCKEEKVTRGQRELCNYEFQIIFIECYVSEYVKEYKMSGIWSTYRENEKIMHSCGWKTSKNIWES